MTSSSIACVIVVNCVLISMVMLLLIDHSTHAAKIKKRKTDSWKSPLPIPLPEPDDFGVPISNVNHFPDENDDDDQEELEPFKYNHIGSPQKLDAGHLCSLNESDKNNRHSQCKKGLECRKIPSDNGNSLGKCTQVDCSSDCLHRKTENILHCPKDSYLQINQIENNGQICCFRYCTCHTCVANKEKCPRGFKKLEESNGMPGRCCDSIQCSNSIHRNCSGPENQTYGSGQLYHRSDDCHQCECIDGVWQCDAVTQNCPIECLPQNSSEIHLEPGQCCLPCKGCEVDQKKYEHLQTFIHDCRRCECKNEKLICDIEFGGGRFCDRDCTINEDRVWDKDKCCDKCVCKPQCLSDKSKLCQCEDINNTQSSINPLINIANNDSSSSNNNIVVPMQSMNDSRKQDESDSIAVGTIACVILFFGLVCGIICLFCHYAKSKKRTKHCSSIKKSSTETIVNSKNLTKTENGNNKYLNNDQVESKLILAKNNDDEVTQMEPEEEEEGNEETKIIHHQ